MTGKVSTIVVTPTATATDSALGAGITNSGGGHGLSSGAVAGIVVGLALLIGAIIGAVVFFVLRKRHRRNLDAISASGGYATPSHGSRVGNTGMPSRQVSQMSSAGLLSRNPGPNSAIVPGSASTYNNDVRGAGAASNADRSSTHMTVDQRLNPWAIYSNEDSRVSNVSLNDASDYSRQLRVANPDPH